MNIGLFGGAFDPPHLGHFTVARTLLEKKYVDVVWFMPVGHDPFDKKLKANGHRVRMLELGIADQPMELQSRMRVKNYELEKAGKSYSLETLDFFSAQNPQDTFFWIVGSDQLPNFHKWKNFQQILDRYGVWVYRRKGFELQPWRKGMQLIEGEVVEISSSQVRQAISAHQSIEQFLPRSIQTYILQQKLYVAADQEV